MIAEDYKRKHTVNIHIKRLTKFSRTVYFMRRSLVKFSYSDLKPDAATKSN